MKNKELNISVQIDFISKCFQSIMAEPQIQDLAVPIIYLVKYWTYIIVARGRERASEEGSTCPLGEEPLILCPRWPEK